VKNQGYLPNEVFADYLNNLRDTPLVDATAADGDVQAMRSSIGAEPLTPEEVAARDRAYMDAVNRGDMATAQRMVDQRAQETGAMIFNAPDTTAFTARRKPPPKKTVARYKAFRLVNGELRPLYVGASESLPMGVWLDAREGGYHFADDKGSVRVPAGTGISTKIPNKQVAKDLAERGFIANENIKTIKTVAYRPGWHAGSLPFNPQGAGRIDPDYQPGNPTPEHPYRHILGPDIVIAEVEMAADRTDHWTQVYERTATRTKAGDINVARSGVREVPVDGYYDYTTNAALANEPGTWSISGSLKINRLLTAQEANRILRNAGVNPQLRAEDAVDVASIDQERLSAAGSKLSDPVTYDDNGNVIPLSERFDPDVSDIRYSLSSIGTAAATRPPAGPTTTAAVEQQPIARDSSVRSAVDYVTSRDWYQQAENNVLFTTYIADKVTKVNEKVGTALRQVLRISRRREAVQRTWERATDRVNELSSKMNAQQFDQVWGLINRSVVEGAWPYAPPGRPELYDPGSAIAKEFTSMTSDQQGLVRAVYAHNNAVRDAELAALDQIVGDLEGVTPAVAEKYLHEVKKPLLEMSSLPYSSMRAVGKYIVVGKSAQFLELQEQVRDTSMNTSARAQLQKALDNMRSQPDHFRVFSVDSQKEGEALQRELGARFGGSVEMHPINGRLPDDLLPFQAIRRVRDAINTEAKKNPKDAKATFAMLQLIDRVYVQSLADSSARKKELKRFKSVELSPQQMYRAFMRQAFSDAHYIATLSTHKELSEQINFATAEASRSGDLAVQRAADEVYERFERSYEYAPSWATSAAMNTTATWMLLTKPAYYLYNATQPIMIAHPYLVSLGFGASESYRALNSAFKDVGKAKNINPFVEFSFDGITNAKGEQTMLRRLQKDGMLEQAMVFDATQVQNIGSKGGSLLEGASAAGTRVLHFLRNSAGKVEQLNRAYVAVAAYRLGLKKFNGDKEKAYELAYDVIDKSQFDYGSMNKPTLIGKNNFRRVVAQFRTFQFGQIAVLFRMLADSGLSTQEKRAAFKGLSFLIGHHTLVGGAIGLPGAITAAFAFSALGPLFGADEPWDAEAWLRRNLGDSTAANMLVYGIPAGLFNINVAQNLGMGTTFSVVPFSDVSLSREGFSETVMGLLGPSVGLASQMATAMERMYKGDFYGGLINMLPSGLKTTLQSMRETAEGVSTRRGDLLVSPEEITAYESILKSLGFTTHTAYIRNFTRDRSNEFQKFFDAKTTRLKTNYNKAAKEGDRYRMEELKTAWIELQEFKLKYGFRAQPLRDLMRSPSEQRRREQETIGGVQVRRSRELVESLIGE